MSFIYNFCLDVENIFEIIPRSLINFKTLTFEDLECIIMLKVLKFLVQHLLLRAFFPDGI